MQFAELLEGTYREFQQKNVSIHIANSTKSWLNSQNTKVYLATKLHLVAYSPDLNFTANLIFGASCVRKILAMVDNTLLYRYSRNLLNRHYS